MPNTIDDVTEDEGTADLRRLIEARRLECGSLRNAFRGAQARRAVEEYERALERLFGALRAEVEAQMRSRERSERTPSA